MFPRFLWALFACLLLSLTGCGGGSDSTTSTGTAPTLTTQPTSQTAALGSSASFSVAATTTGSDTLTYQWRKAGTAISGATAATYTIATVAATDAGDYDVLVSNSAGSVSSAVATLSVSTTSGTPLITTEPASRSATTGTPVTFSVTATGSGTLAYQWRKDGTVISGATGSSLALASVSATDAGRYDVVVGNSAGSTTSAAAVLTVTASVSGTHSAQVTTAAQAFYATLTTAQQTSVQRSYSLATARRWSNLPAAMVARNGIAWSSLSTAQKTAARTLIATALSAAGNQLHLDTQAADNVLVSSYGASTASYGEGHYYIAFLGTPSSSTMWMLQLTGHHLTYNLALNATYRSATPVFVAIEPKDSFTYNGSTVDPMAAQRTAIAALGTALGGYGGAQLSGSYDDVLFGANGSGGIDGTLPKSYPTGTTGRGVLYTSLSAADQEKVKTAIRAYVNTQATEVADELLGAYLSDAALAQTYAAYGTGTSITTRGHYFRIDGPRVWIEWSVQNGVLVRGDIHPHTVWRDKLADYGGAF